MPRIVFIAANEFHSWGGSEALWGAAVERLLQRRVRVSASVKHWPSPVNQVEKLCEMGCVVFYRFPASLPQRILHKLPLWPDSTKSHLAKIANHADLIVISQSMHTDGLPWMEAARSCGFRYAVIAQTAAESWWPDDTVAARLAASYEGACAAYFVSTENLALSRRQFVTPLLNGRVVRNPFNVCYNAHSPWPPNSSDELRLACVGRLDVVQKSQDLLLQVLDLPRWRSRSIHLSLAGSGANERALRRAVEDLRLTNVSFGGFVGDIEQLWAGHHALVLPSRHEGMPLVLVEAMLCGRPAIATDVGGVRELLRDSINGFLVKAPTVELLDEAMNRAWEGRHCLEEMGQQAAIDVRQFVGPDPADDFARELIALAGGSLT